MNLYEYQRSRSFIDLGPRSLRFTFSNFFSLETVRPIEVKFHMEPPWDVGNEHVLKYSRSHDHAHTCIWWKTSKIFFSGTKSLMTLKHGIQHWVLEYYQCFHVMTLGWPSPFLRQGQMFPNASVWVKAYTALSAKVFPIQHILST